MKLTENFVGKQVRITDVSSVSDLVKRRLVDFGIMEGTVIKLKKRCPLEALLRSNPKDSGLLSDAGKP
nr:ferrous iron transport protein A [Paenibacillus larvae]